MIRLLRTRVVARALVGLAVVALVATSCDYKPSDETAISVNGHVTTMAAYSKLLSGMEAGKKCIESLGVSPKISFDGQSYNAGAVRFAANLVVQNAAIDNVLAANSLFVTAEQKSVAATSMSTNCPNGEDKKLSPDVLQFLVDFIAGNAAVAKLPAGVLTNELTSLQVDVSSRIGVWNPTAATVETPPGPVKVRAKITLSSTTVAP